MWVLAGLLWILLKSMAFQTEGGAALVDPRYFAWVGTDAAAFRRDRREGGGLLVNRARPLVSILVALGMLGFLTLEVDDPIVVGWVGIAAMLCLLHFGLFDLLAVFWGSRGYSVIPIMDSPWKAASLADFWGNRWNRAFSRWARIHVFGPLSRRYGASLGLIGGFLVSGLVHEIVISFPAGSGWGLPTLYFLMQAAGVLCQRSIRCLRGILPTLLAVLCPAPLLFHPPFLERVFAPMIRLAANVV
jgi:alginate O-acetyltransferase complex protein AlgI